MQDGATGMLTDIERESSLDGSETLPQDSRTSSGHSWLTGHQEPMSWSLRSASGVMPEVEEVTIVPVTQQVSDHHPYSTGEEEEEECCLFDHHVSGGYIKTKNFGLDVGANDTTEERSTGVSLHRDNTDNDDMQPTEPNDDSSQTLEATHGDAVWSMAVANALVDWGIAGSFQYSTKTRQLGLSAQRHARYGYILLLT